MTLRGFQEIAVKELKEKANKLLDLSGTKTIVFEAPTGSGKTVMMAEFLKTLVEEREDEKRFSIIWIAPRQLHIQSKEKLEKYFYDSKALRCSHFEDLSDKRIDENEILFLNWESINKTDNIYIRDNENDFNLSKVINNTLADDRIIILVIDESHFAAKAENSLDLIKIIQAKVSVDVSATPHIQGDELVNVPREKVIEDQMIKKRIVINPGFKNIINKISVDGIQITTSASESTDEFVIRKAIEKRKELKAALESEGSEVNPLLLIQMPDKKQGLDDMKEDIISILKSKHNITIENRKLAIYLSENKENLESITRNNDEVEVMIFKQAIALGWDCPRACILVLFRDWKSITFSVQTLGRILRMPELKHYNVDQLNTGFVYTNLADISIQEDIAGSYLMINYSNRKNIYKNILLRSVHSKRFREETRLSPQFITDFVSAADEMKLSKRMIKDVKDVYQQIISDGVITNPDKVFEHLENDRDIFDEHSKETVDIKQNEVEIQRLFDLFVRDSLTPLAPEKRSIGRVKEAIYRYFKNTLPFAFEYGGIESQMAVLHPQNRQLFIDTINSAKDIYLTRVGKGKKALETDSDWEIPSSLSYNNNYEEKKTKCNLMEPFFIEKTASTPEIKFIEYLESKENEIEWWFKNGERDGIYFAIPYKKNDLELPFYVDWIVKYKNGRIGLFDSKAGITAETTKEKAEGLAKYIKEENKKGKKLFGGIVIERDKSWRLNDNEKYSYNEKDLSGWKFL